jgi:hypothetical protein
LLSSLAATVAMTIPAAPAAAQAVTETNQKVQDFSILRSTTQAGAHPVVDIRMRFCNDGVEIVDAGAADPLASDVGAPIRIRTAAPHGVTSNGVPLRVIYVDGNTAANGLFTSRLVPISATEFSTTELDLLSSGQPVTGNGDYTGGGELHSQQNADPSRADFGCSEPAPRSFLKDFTLKLPPGFLGNPTAVLPCPTHLWLAGSCPDRSQLGHAFAEGVSGGGTSSSIISVPTSVFNLQTMGLEPARLGTEVVPAFPPGPLPNSITIRTTGD